MQAATDMKRYIDNRTGDAGQPPADPLEGCWRLVEARAWDENGQPLPAPYGQHPMGAIVFERGRMIAALCNADAELGALARREYSSYGGTYTFDGRTLDVLVDVAADASRIGGHQVREVDLRGGRMSLRPPTRGYGGSVQQRELLWERIA